MLLSPLPAWQAGFRGMQARKGLVQETALIQATFRGSQARKEQQELERAKTAREQRPPVRIRPHEKKVGKLTGNPFLRNDSSPHIRGHQEREAQRLEEERLAKPMENAAATKIQASGAACVLHRVDGEWRGWWTLVLAAGRWVVFDVGCRYGEDHALWHAGRAS